ncbi:MAG: decaprenyl-phosphate phosphoribosyltransferase [Proteobacteria bacterium]|nr:decaprenyl-phosphate phosphoribosyltransferase [Pseudomonadota bacterium]
MKWLNVLELLRPHQWLKNLFVLAPLFFSFHFTESNIVAALLGFVLFSLAASSIYVLNDYHDIEEDRQHPTKCNRPLASGTVSKPQAVILMLVLWGVVAVGAYALNPAFLAIVVGYVLLNVLYSFKLKHIPILDITIIAIGFVLRVFSGAILIAVTPTLWIVLVTFLLALFLALAKRRDDCLLARDGLKTRKNIDGYNLELVNAAMVLMAAVTLVSYIMYTVSPEVATRFGSEYLYLTSLFVIVGMLRYMQITFVEENSGSPTKLLLKDRFLQLTLVGWGASFGLIKLL